MSYTCGRCGMYVGDNQTHYCGYTWNCPSYWIYPPYSSYPVSDRTVHCMKKECIYWSAVSHFEDNNDGRCGNKSLLMDEFGCCRCFVKNNEGKTSDEQTKA